MIKLFQKAFTSFKKRGLRTTIKKTIVYLSNMMIQRGLRKKMFALNNAEDRFTLMYEKNYWRNEETVSGAGSTIEYTENLRNKLPELFEKFSVQTIFDAPCGDFNWMSYVLKENNLNYIGGDIVAPLIEDLNLKYKNNTTKFIDIDSIKDKFPEADLMICRNCLIHLSFRDMKHVLENYIDSNIPYMLTTTYLKTDNFQNKDIKTGHLRPVDLFASPFHFSKDVYFRIEDGRHPRPNRDMCLWTRQQIIDALEKFNDI